MTVPGSPFSISARRAISGRPLVEGERQREKEARARGSALTPRRIISVSTDPSFWPARIFRPLRPTNFDQLTRKGMGSRHFPPVHVYALSCFPYTAARWLSTRVYRLCCCVQRPERMLWMRPAWNQISNDRNDSTPARCVPRARAPSVLASSSNTVKITGGEPAEFIDPPPRLIRYAISMYMCV